jgi:hypothetical protein
MKNLTVKGAGLILARFAVAVQELHGSLVDDGEVDMAIAPFLDESTRTAALWLAASITEGSDRTLHDQFVRAVFMAVKYLKDQKKFGEHRADVVFAAKDCLARLFDYAHRHVENRYVAKK